MTRPDAARVAAWIGVVLLTLYLVFVGGAWEGIYNAYLRQVSMILAGVALAAWIALAAVRPAWRPRSVLLPAIAAVLTSLALSTEFSRYPRQSIEYLGYAIVLAAFYLLLVRLLAAPFFRPRIEALAVALTVLLGGTYVVTNAGNWIAWWGVVGKITVPPLRPDFESLTFGNPSAVLTIELLFWCSAAAVIGMASQTRRTVVASLGLLTLFALIVSGSRAGWFAVGTAVLAIAAIWLAHTQQRLGVVALARGWLTSTRSRIAVAAIGLGLVVGLIVLGPTLASRLTLVGADLRTNYVLAAIRMFADAPIFGTGPGTWVIQRIRYTEASEADFYIPHAHDIYAQTLAELGIVGAIVGLILFVSLAWLIRDAIHDPVAVRRRWGWAAAFGLIYFGAHQLLDFYANMPAALFAAAIPVAWLDATATRSISRPPVRWPTTLAPLASVVAVVLAVVSVAGLVLTERPAELALEAVLQANNGQWAAADATIRDAVAMDASWSPYQMTMGLAAARVGDHQRAADAFRLVALADDLPEAWLDLAAEERILGHTDAATAAIHEAARLGLQAPASAMAIGDLASRLGETQLEIQAFSAALLKAPSLAEDPWWHADPARSANLPQILDAAVLSAGPNVGWQIALAAGDVNRARNLVAVSVGPPETVAPDVIIDAWGGDTGALTKILATCDAHPLDSWCLAWAARVEGRLGNLAAADRYRQWASTVSSGTDVFTTDLRVSDHDQIGRTLQGSAEDFWGTYSYRRPTPWNHFVPGLVQLILR